VKNCLLFLIIYIISTFSRGEEYLLRRTKSPVAVQDNISIFTSDGSTIFYFWDHFPDGEIYIRLHNPEAVEGQDIKLQFQAQDREDFLRLLFLVSTIAEYSPKSIEVEFQNWIPQNRGEEAILSSLAHFVDGIKLPAGGKFSFYTRSIKPFVSKFDAVLYLKPRFQKYARGLGEKFDTDVYKIAVSQSGLHWDLQIPQDVKNKDILIIHSIQSCDDILNLISALYSLKEAGTRSITLVNTYQGYARQDKIFKPGEGITGYALLKVLNSLTEYNLALNVHYGERSGEVRLRDEPVFNLNGFGYLAEGVFEHILEDFSLEKLEG
jgi:hypothetical protein